MRALLTGILLFSMAATAVAGSARDLEKTRNAYYDARYKRAVRLGTRVADNEEASNDEVVEALKFAAYASFLLADRDSAHELWVRLLNVDASFRADPMEVSPELVEYFSAIPPPQPTPDPAAEPATDAAPESASPPAQLDSPGAEVTRGCGTWMCAIPFGFGQLRNQNLLKAGIFASAELAFLATNIGLYWKNKTEFERNGYFPDEGAAERRHTLQLVFAGLFIATAIGGVVDAFLFP